MTTSLKPDQVKNLISSCVSYLERVHKGDMFPSRLYDAAFKFALNRQVVVGDFSDLVALNLGRKQMADKVATAALQAYLQKGHVTLQEVVIEKDIRNRDGDKVPYRRVRLVVINNKRVKMSDTPTPHAPSDLPQIVTDTLNILQEQELAVDTRVAKMALAITSSLVYAVGGSVDMMEGGGLKYATQMRSLSAFMKETHGGKAKIQFTWQYLSGRFYVMSPVHHMQGDPCRAIFCLPKAETPTKRGEKMAYRYWAKEFGVYAGNYERIISFFRDAWKKSYEDKAKGKPEFTVWFLAGLRGLGISPKRAMRTFAAALAMQDLLTTGKTSYIFFPDATSDGMQRLAALTGDKTLGHFTNIQASARMLSLYKILGKLVLNRLGIANADLKVFLLDRDGKLSKDMTKWPVMRLIYGSGKDSLAKGMLFADPSDAEGIVDEEGNQLPKVVEEMVRENPDCLNETYEDAILKVGLDKSLNAVRRLARLYEAAIKTLAPKWQEFIRVSRAIFKRAVDNGKPMEWVLGAGATRIIETWDLDEESPRRLIEIRTAIGQTHRISVKEIRPSTRASKAPPLIMHADDGYHVMKITKIFNGKKSKSKFYLPLHDAHGVGIINLAFIKKVWKHTFAQMYFGQNRLYNLIKKWGIKTNLFKDGPEFLSRDLLMQSKYCLGC